MKNKNSKEEIETWIRGGERERQSDKEINKQRDRQRQRD
jgi:hypothetical protein